MAERLSSLHDISADFLQSYNTYQAPTLKHPSQRFYFPSIETKQDAIQLSNFLNNMEDQLFQPQFPIDYIPPYPSSKALYPTLDLDYSQPADLTPTTQLYPPLFDQAAVPPTSTYMGMGSRMAYDQTKLVSTGVLQRAPPRAGSEELVHDMEKMDVDSEAKEKKPEKESEDETKEKDVKAKHLALIKKLQKVVHELILEREKEESRVEIKQESPEEKLVSIAAH
jgi:hypothetical protein